MKMSSSFFTDPTQKRLVLLPIRHPNLWEIFKEQQSVLWTTEEIDWAGDQKDWKTLSSDAKDFLLRIIAFLIFLDVFRHHQ